MLHGKLCQCPKCQPIQEPKIKRVIWFDDGDLVKIEAERIYYYNDQWFVVGTHTERSGNTYQSIYHLATWGKMEGGGK